MGLLLRVNDTEIRLYQLENGLADLDWDANGTALLHSIDIQALLENASKNEIPAWGAEIAWPRLGRVRLVILPLSETSLTGFLISHPGDNTVVRQMEFRQVFGPQNRPLRAPPSPADGS